MEVGVITKIFGDAGAPPLGWGCDLPIETLHKRQIWSL